MTWRSRRFWWALLFASVGLKGTSLYECLQSWMRNSNQNMAGSTSWQVPQAPSTIVTSDPPLEDYTQAARDEQIEAEMSGPGLVSAMAGHTAYIDVRLLKEVVTQSESYGTQEFYAYATFQSEDTAFAVPTRLESPSFRLEYTSPRPGIYRLSIDFLTRHGIFPLFSNRNINITFEGTFEPVHADPQRCQEVTDIGEWRRCTAKGLHMPHECLRWGWTFRPFRNCYYEVWTPRQLAAYALTRHTERRWIMFLGTSVIRGVFLSAVDHLLGASQGELEGIFKCWGRADVEVGKIRLTYQDFRAPDFTRWPLSTKKQRAIECHGDRVASEDFDFQQNATAFVRHHFQLDKPPTAVVLDWRPRMDQRVYRALVDIPKGWHGDIFVLNFRNAVFMESIDGERPAEALRELENLFQRPIRLLDLKDITKPWLRFTEGGTTALSVHWHKAGGERTPFAVEGIVTDTAAQIIYHTQLGPRPIQDDDWVATYNAIADTKPSVKVCLDCPPSMLPLHTIPLANLTCYDRLPPADVGAHHIHEVRECPSWGLEQATTGTVDTMSGPVQQRKRQAQASQQSTETDP